MDTTTLPAAIKLTGVRRMIADKMCASLATSAQVTYHAEIDATELQAARTRCKALELRVGYEDLIIVRLAESLRKFPQLNAVVESNEARLSNALHVSVAVSLPGALVAPAIFDADGKSLTEIASARQDVIARAKVNKLSVKEMTGGTFTISNLGTTRVDQFTPIVNAPQIAILGIGRVVERACVVGGKLAVRPIMGLSLTTDHRFIDGQPSGEFLTDLCQRLEQAWTIVE